MCCSPWGGKKSDTTERLNSTEIRGKYCYMSGKTTCRLGSHAKGRERYGMVKLAHPTKLFCLAFVFFFLF